MHRCGWCEASEKMIAYHDTEWGVPLHDDQRQFEFLMMEVMQCGLNWNMMIEKREIFRACFAGFDYDQAATFGEAEIARILAYPGMIRSRRKVEAVIQNARCFQAIRAEYGSFSNYLWRYTGGVTYLYPEHQTNWVAKNALSDEISRDLRRRGFKYLGSITVYSHLQACGIINDHEADCTFGQALKDMYPWREVSEAAGEIPAHAH